MKPNLLLSFFLCALLGAATVSADVLHLKNGDTLTGKITGRADGKVTMQGALFGQVVINESDIADYKLGDAPTAAAPKAAPTTAAPSGTAVAMASSSPAANPGGSNSTFQGRADAPEKPFWSRSITFGGTYVSPTFNQDQLPGAPAGVTGASLGLPGRVLGIQASANFLRATQSDVHALDLTYAYTDLEPSGRQTDNYSGAFIWNHKLSERYYTVSRTSYSVDQVKNIDYSAVQLFGVGYKIIDTPQTKFDIVPGVLAMQEKKGNAFDGEFQYGGGFLESFVYNFNAAASFQQRVLYRQSFKESELYAVDAYIGFKGMLSPRLGLTVGLTYTYDNSLGPVSFPFGGTTVTLIAQEKDQLNLTSGVQYKF